MIRRPPRSTLYVYRRQRQMCIRDSRNSAVCPLLGRLPASETYKNPYISPVSLQLDAQSGVYPPHWGFCGFPRHVFINTGRAELNSEQHVTLAHRMAEGTVSGVPQYSGDCDYSEDRAHNMSWRDQFPRTKGWVSVSYTHLTLPTIHVECRSRWSPYH